MSVEKIQAKTLDDIPSKFPLIQGKEMGKMHLHEFGVGSDGVKRSCCKMEAFKGFHWSQCMPASVGGPMPEGVQLCPKAHFGYMVSGKMKVMMPDTGEEKVIGAGDAYHIEPRHDAVVLEDCVMVEFEASAAEYYGKMEQ